MTVRISEVQNTSLTEIQRIFEAQRNNQSQVRNTTAAQRKTKLKKLHDAIIKYRAEIRQALYDDFKKHPSEVDLTEVYPVVGAIKHTKSHLRNWMSKRPVDTPLALLGSSSYIQYEPKGTVLIISPWNFPVNLSFGPLVSAIAAGNTVMLKPSEKTPNASALMRKIIGEIFNENEVAVVEGEVPVATALLNLPFNHIFFTGAPEIGKIVMAAAAKHLTSVTLELGGKSPTIIDETANIDQAARRIAWAKFLNNGQICIAPDYVFVHEKKKAAFLEKVDTYIKQYYSADPDKSDSYCRMVNQQHFKRVKSYVEDALEKGAKVAAGGEMDESNNYIAPTVMTNVSKDASLMGE